MSANMGNGKKINRVSIPDLASRKNGEPVVSLTAYTAPMAKILDPHCDFLLVGDSLGIVNSGFNLVAYSEKEKQSSLGNKIYQKGA